VKKGRLEKVRKPERIHAEDHEPGKDKENGYPYLKNFLAIPGKTKTKEHSKRGFVDGEDSLNRIQLSSKNWCVGVGNELNLVNGLNQSINSQIAKLLLYGASTPKCD